MITEVDERFVKDIKGIFNKVLKKNIARYIECSRVVSSIHEIPGIKKLRGYNNHYRIRIGDYRIGLSTDGHKVIFVRFLHRKEIYRRFP